MRDLALFATSVWPLHPSGMAAMLKCPWKVAMNYLEPAEGDPGRAADTGSAMHAAAAAMHNGKEVAESLAIMQAGIASYPLADLADAADMFLKYATDTRNRNARILLTEQLIRFQITPAKEDPTGAPIEVEGTVDQVREENGVLWAMDIKTSKLEPMTLMFNHQLQVAAYMVGASIHLGRQVQRAAIILPRKYKDRDPSTAPVFWRYAWTLQDTDTILEGVRHTVARIRSGDIWHMPGDQCMWCAAKSPDLCMPRLQSTLRLLRG